MLSQYSLQQPHEVDIARVQSTCQHSLSEATRAVPADKVAVMKGGRIVAHGTYRELLARGVDFHAALDEGAGSVERLSVVSAYSLPDTSVFSTAPGAEAASASAAPLVPAPDLFQRPYAAPSAATTASDAPQLTGPAGLAGVAAQVSESGLTHESVPDSQAQVHGEAVAVSVDAPLTHAENGAAAAEQADCKTLDLVSLLAPTVNGGAAPEAASGALPDATAPRGRGAESRGWRDVDGKVAGGRSASRKGRLVYVRYSLTAWFTVAQQSIDKLLFRNPTTSTYALVVH